MPYGSRNGSPGKGDRGSAGGHRTVDTRPSLELIIGGKVKPNAKGCWIYNDNPHDYGQAVTRAGTIIVHRFVYETLVGPIPQGYHVHHECGVRGCCNPDHLTAMSVGDHLSHHAQDRPRDWHGRLVASPER